MAGTHQTKRFLMAGAALVALLVAITVFWPREPTYKGATVYEWLSLTNREQHQAILTLGTKRIPTLVKHLAYDEQVDPILTLYWKVPTPIANFGPVLDFVVTKVSRKACRASDAGQVLQMLGPRAAPAIPELHRIAKECSSGPAVRAICVLDSMGQPGWDALASLTQTNSEQVIPLLHKLAGNTASLPVHRVLTNALASPNRDIWRTAASVITGSQ
jgi:hypothetical protein